MGQRSLLSLHSKARRQYGHLGTINQPVAGPLALYLPSCVLWPRAVPPAPASGGRLCPSVPAVWLGYPQSLGHIEYHSVSHIMSRHTCSDVHWQSAPVMTWGHPHRNTKGKSNMLLPLDGALLRLLMYADTPQEGGGLGTLLPFRSRLISTPVPSSQPGTEAGLTP